MEELLREVLDRMREAWVVDRPCARVEATDVRRLRSQIEVVLDKGYYRGTLVEIDLRQLPPVL